MPLRTKILIIVSLWGTTLSWATPSAAGAPCPQGRLLFDSGAKEVALKTCVHLKNLSLSEDSIVGARITSSLLENVVWNELKVQNVNLTGSELQNVKMTKLHGSAVFNTTHWRGGFIEDSRLQKSVFDDSLLDGIRWINSDFSHSSLRRVRGRNCYLQKVSLEDADLRGAKFENCIFLGVNLRRALFNNDTQLPLSPAQRSVQGMVYQP